MINDTVQLRVNEALDAFHARSPRAALAREGFLGPSDIGFCRQKAKLVTEQVSPTDNPPKWAAFIGTSLGKEIELALAEANPDWIVGSVSGLKVTAKLPSGVEISGHPDLVCPDLNAVLDIKTVDGLASTRRNGASQSHRYQRHLYALACIQQGILDDTQPVYVGNIYFDRSGGEPEPLIEIQELDPTLTPQIDSWVQDVIYAVKTREDASRDVPAALCERICEFFTVCRGSLPLHEGGITIKDPQLLQAIEMHIEATAMEKEAKAMKEAAKDILAGTNGQSETHQIRWVDVGPAVVPEQHRSGYTRLDIRPVKKRLPV